LTILLGSDFGGVWYWNRYPGARVDSETPFYQLNIPEVYNNWSFSQRFPDHRELRKYFAHVDKTLDLRKNVSFDTRVNDCTWDRVTAQWTVKTVTGVIATAQWLILATGILHKTHLPLWPGKERYEGTMYHSSDWPEDTNFKAKRVAVIGAGATSVQIVQELAKQASHLTLLMRRPSYCLPMGQRSWTEEEQRVWRSYYPALFSACRNSAVGLPTVRRDVRVQDVSPQEREAYFEALWACGGVHFLLRNYNNVMIDKEANKIVYEFWKNKVRARLTDPKKQALMAPDEMPYFFSTRRTPLEHDYYEVLNQDNVDIVDLNKHPTETFTERGLQLDGEEQDRQYDYIIYATGFDSFTGSLTTMGLKSKDGIDIKDIWSEGVRTYLGLTIHGFPNAFMVYSPQAPTALSNAPTIIECQVDFICDTISALRRHGARSIEPTREAAEQWKEGLERMVEKTLYPYTKSWWNTSNIPGKRAEQQNYILGIQRYEMQVRETMEGWKGFDVTM
jgi:cation diffusion facilitator CzcD-associated flavoprotein CzcO